MLCIFDSTAFRDRTASISTSFRRPLGCQLTLTFLLLHVLQPCDLPGMPTIFSYSVTSTAKDIEVHLGCTQPLISLEHIEAAGTRTRCFCGPIVASILLADIVMTQLVNRDERHNDS